MPAPRLIDTRDAKLWLFFATVLICAHYQLQHYLWIPFSAPARAIALGVIFLAALQPRPKIVLDTPPLLIVLGLLVGIAAAQTWIIFGPSLAIAGTARFVNVMLLAPLASLLLVHAKDLRRFLLAYLLIMVVTLSSVLFQHFGGRLDLLVRDYIAIRADLVRHFTTSGEPNVGGMLGVLAFTIGILVPRRNAVSIAFAALGLVLATFSISKAAAIGMVIAVVAIAVLTPVPLRKKTVVRGIASGILAFVMILGVEAWPYLDAMVRSVFGQIRGEPGAFADFAARQDGTEFLKSDNLLVNVLRVVFGNSFGIAGSAAWEHLGNVSMDVLPHNSYREVFLVGGFAMVLTLVCLMGRAGLRLWRDTRADGQIEDRCALICLVTLSAWMLSYPVIYEPVSGSLFWLLIGYGNRPRLHRAR